MQSGTRKAAAIADVGLLRWLEGAVAPLVAADPDALEQAVLRSVAVKGRVVSRDERETGRRAMLNFGHTVGHAVEAVSGYSVAHGEAVAVGMVVEAWLATERTGFPRRHVTRLRRLLLSLGLPVRPPEGIAVRDVLHASRLDKKSRRGRTFAMTLAEELLAAYRREGAAYTKRENTHKMAEANKAFSHFAW